MPRALDKIYPWARILTLAYLVMEIAYFIHTIFFWRFLHAIKGGQYSRDELIAWSAPLDLWGGFVGIGLFGTLIAAMVVNGMWIYRVAENAQYFAPGEKLITPGWAVGWHAIPFANLVMPFRAMKQIWNASDPAGRALTDRLPGFFTLWWACWILGNALANVSFRYASGETITAKISGANVDLVGGPVSLVNGVLFLLIIERTTRNQRMKDAQGPVDPGPETEGEML